jgi:transcriptional regulator with XRE-family HTH domain
MSRKEVNFVLKLSDIRKNKGLTQQDLANILHINRVTLARYESESIKLDQNNMIKICIALETTPNELLGFEKAYKSYNEYLMSLKEKG